MVLGLQILQRAFMLCRVTSEKTLAVLKGLQATALKRHQGYGIRQVLAKSKGAVSPSFWHWTNAFPDEAFFR